MDLEKIDMSKVLNLDEIKVETNIAQNHIRSIINEQERRINEVAQSKREREELEEKRHNELLSVGKEQVEQLKAVNTQLSVQLNSVNQTLDFILNSMGSNFQRIEKQHILENQTLAELLFIISSKDKNKLKSFITEHGVESIALILQTVSFIAGK